MLSVATYLLALTAAAAPVKAVHRADDSSRSAEAQCSAGDSLECIRQSVAGDLESPALAAPPCSDGALEECTPDVTPLRSGASLADGAALCDADDSAECLAPPVHANRPAPAVILSCENSYLETMIGSCDLPDEEPAFGRPLHVPTLHSGAATRLAFFSTGHGQHAVVVSSLRSTDGAWIASAPLRLSSNPPASALFVSLRGPASPPAPPRLDRPPRV